MTVDENAPAEPATILARMTSAGISEARALEHIRRGVVHLGGEPVTDPASPAPWPTRWVVGSDGSS